MKIICSGITKIVNFKYNCTETYHYLNQNLRIQFSKREIQPNNLTQQNFEDFFFWSNWLIFLTNYKLFQKLHLLGNSEFNHLTIILTILSYRPKMPLNKCGPTHEIFNILNGRKSEN